MLLSMLLNPFIIVKTFLLLLEELFVRKNIACMILMALFSDMTMVAFMGLKEKNIVISLLLANVLLICIVMNACSELKYCFFFIIASRGLILLLKVAIVILFYNAFIIIILLRIFWVMRIIEAGGGYNILALYKFGLSVFFL